MVTKTLAVRSTVQAELKKLCRQVFFGHAEFSGKRTYPYLVYALEELSYDDGATLCELEVNAVDFGRDTGPVETLCDQIQKAFRGYVHIDDDVGFAVYQGRRQTVPEEDRNIIRRRLTFEVRLHERR